MSASLRAFMVVLSDVTLYVLIACVTSFAVDTWFARKSNGRPLLRFSDMMAGLAIFFGWFGLVYLDRRFDVVSWVDLVKWMGYEWYWPFRLLLIIVVTRMWWTLRRTALLALIARLWSSIRR